MRVARVAAMALGVVALLSLALRTTTVPSAAAPSQQEVVEAREAPEIRQAIEAAIDPEPHRIHPDTQREIARLPQVTIDTTGDLTVVLALRDEGTKEGIRAAGEQDALAVFRAIYTSSASNQIRTATLIGTFGIARAESNRTRERRILRASLSAESAAGVDWSAMTAEHLPGVVDVWWLYPSFRPGNDLEG